MGGNVDFPTLLELLPAANALPMDEGTAAGPAVIAPNGVEAFAVMGGNVDGPRLLEVVTAVNEVPKGKEGAGAGANLGVAPNGARALLDMGGPDVDPETLLFFWTPAFGFSSSLFPFVGSLTLLEDIFVKGLSLGRGVFCQLVFLLWNHSRSSFFMVGLSSCSLTGIV